MEPGLNTDFTDSAEQSLDSLENEALSKKLVPTKDSTSSRKDGAGRRRGAGQVFYYPATSLCNYYSPGCNRSFGLWNDRVSSIGDGQSRAPKPSYGCQTPGLMKYYGPAGIDPPSQYRKQGQCQSGRPMECKSKEGRIWSGSSSFDSRDKITRKGDYEASNELTRGPRVNNRNDSLDSASMEHKLKEGGIWNGCSRFDSRDKPARKGGYEASNELACGPRVNKRNDSVDSASISSIASGLGKKCNVEEFQTEYEKARFYVIKSYSEDDVHQCIKFDVWSSTPTGNKKLDAAFHDAQVRIDQCGKCPIFLFFSVNGSGQFVGLAEMIGKVDYNKSMNFWQLDKWSGFFPVKWHIIKDIPNPRLRHIRLENNGNRPVTYTRDTQEIGLSQGLEMLKIFKGYTAKSSILDDFEFYEDREKALDAEKSSKPASRRTDVCWE